MPFYFRKTKKAGPFRITASKSGITTSVGGGGIRLTTGPHGTHVKIGSRGVAYQQRLRLPSGGPKPPVPARVAGDSTDFVEVETAPVEQLVDASFSDVLLDLNRPRGSWLRRLFRGNLPFSLDYDLDQPATERFQLLSNALMLLSKSHVIWRVDASRLTRDRKHHAGANALVQRHPVSVAQRMPPGILTNVPVMGMYLGDISLHFMPDVCLVRQRKLYGSVIYSSLKAVYGETEFRESGRVPADAEIIGQTWQYVNKSGGADRRFKQNRNIPIARYGTISLQAANGLNVLLEVSNWQLAQQFCRSFMEVSTK